MPIFFFYCTLILNQHIQICHYTIQEIFILTLDFIQNCRLLFYRRGDLIPFVSLFTLISDKFIVIFCVYIYWFVFAFLSHFIYRYFVASQQYSMRIIMISLVVLYCFYMLQF